MGIVIYLPRLGDIGEDQKEFEFEPIHEPASVPEPIRTPSPAPAREPEKVPA